ncbi:alkaline phosphatase D family protein [Corynebacterium aquatimens]|uniref:Alkaline phosphatase D n=1 Tax=Corynebacterium aquatimens TaxID=1190508 RepID=A0A931GSJ9_9CORY|nr:alkaline phosphatase D family protein [Corynebacterium aquatimens]MBG6122142.1 alkaline phosphatase D [Corynebacterium aquatimens]WJY65317.1 Phospholipase D precursor [Corynebacterium aquatimens]
MASNNLPRRTFLAGTAATAAGVAAAGVANAASDKGEQASQFLPVKHRPGQANLPKYVLATPEPFMHGVASGDPMSDSVIIWTRLTQSEKSMPGAEVGKDQEVAWEIATDEGFGNVVGRGTATAEKGRDFTVKVEATGLEANSIYYYRFVWEDTDKAWSDQGTTYVSPTGRTKTAAAKGDSSFKEMKIAVASCANFECGFFSAYKEMARQAYAGEIDVVAFLGDYIYEYASGEYCGKSGVSRPTLPDHEILELKDYRERYGRYREDKFLQAAHAAAPWVCIWDDHETGDNSWRLGAFNHTVKDYKYKSRVYKADKISWGKRMWAGHKTYFDWMPVRETGKEIEIAATVEANKDINGTVDIEPKTEPVLYRSFEFGDLVKLIVMDLRSYRDVVLGEELDSVGEAYAIDSKYRTMLGQEQYKWAKDEIESSEAKWNVMGNSVMIAPFELVRLPETSKENKAANEALSVGFANQLGLRPKTGESPTAADGTDKALGGMVGNTDQWDGYRADRTRILDAVYDKKQEGTNTLFITGDIHSEWAMSIHHRGEEIACELVTTSISAPNLDEVLTETLGVYFNEDSRISHLVEAAIRSINPWVNHMDFDSHGFAVATVTEGQVQMDFHRVRNVEDPNASSYLGTTRTWSPAEAAKAKGKNISAGFLINEDNKPKGLSSGSSKRQ